jgi:branched-chain amino acid aminotransferase
MCYKETFILSKNRANTFIYLNNGFVKSDEAFININDRGFRFGDGVFETIRLHKGTLFKIDIHLERLKQSLQSIKIEFDTSKLKQICINLVNKNSADNGFVRISISRGVGSIGYLPENTNNSTLVIQCLDDITYNDEPVDLWLSSYRKIPDICLPSHAKTAQGLSSTLARMEAKENNCFEALLLSVEGNICEGSSGNIFCYKQGRLYTPKNNILYGIMRQTVIEISPYEVIQGDFTIDDLQTAEEVFITNVAWLIKPVKSLQPKSKSWQQTDISYNIRSLIFNA